MDQDLLEGDVITDSYDDRYYLILFSTCQVDLCFDIDLKDGVSRPAQGQRFPIEVSKSPDDGRGTIVDPMNGDIVIG